MEPEHKVMIVLAVIAALIAGGVFLANREEKCHGIQTGNTCLWLPEGTKVDGEVVGE